MKTKYLLNGCKVEVIEKLSRGRFLVQPILTMENYEGDSYYDLGAPEIVEKVFDVAPTKEYDENITHLQNRIDVLNKEMNQITESIEKAEVIKQNLDKKFSRYEALKLLNDFIDGKITHYVIEHYGSLKIVARGDTISEYDNRENLRLLSLYGKSNGDLIWHLNEYSDGSGSKEEVFPCLSFDHALKEAQKRINKHVVEDKYPSSSLVEFAKANNLKISNEYIEKCKESQVNQVKRTLAEHEKAVLADKQRLSELEK
jgi:hypothetical protein